MAYSLDNARMPGKVVRMPRITDSDLELIEASCRRLADQYRAAAPGFWLPSRACALEIAAEWERTAERISAARNKS